MTLFGLSGLLDLELFKESLALHMDESKYAVPPVTVHDDYDEMFREYEIFGGKIFTVMIRKNRSDGKYWVRCGYKDTADSKYVGGLEGRDCNTYSLGEVIDHCKSHLEVVLNQKGW